MRVTSLNRLPLLYRCQYCNAALVSRRYVVTSRSYTLIRHMRKQRSFTHRDISLLLLGCGLAGGVALCIYGYREKLKCRAQSVSLVSPCPTQLDEKIISTGAQCHDEISVGNFGIFQRLKIMIRFSYLVVLFFPAVFLYSLNYFLQRPSLANLNWSYLMFAIQNAGPAFIKLGQWTSTRRDLFGNDLCRALSNLYTRCDAHTWRETERLLEENFGGDWRERLVIVDYNPIGSGCVAQVYQGYLTTAEGISSHEEKPECGSKLASNKDQEGLPTQDSSQRILEGVEGNLEDSRIPIAVKVLHPGIVENMNRDIRLMKYTASWVDYLYPDVHWVALTECVDEFSSVMQKQLDLELEALNLSRFRVNMDGYSHIKFPTPIYPYITKEVLVESFEQGEQISEYLTNPGGELQRCLAKIGVEVVLDMLFIHNFIHGDLHPGNILVQDSNPNNPTLVLLDCGIATSLGPVDLENLHSAFTAIVLGDGAKVADLFLGNQQCSTVDEYRRRMAELVDNALRHLNLRETHVDTLFSNLFNILIDHKVRIDPGFTSVMVAIIVIEGLGRCLDPDLDILAYAKPCVLNRAKKSLRDNVKIRLKKATETVNRMKASLSNQKRNG